MIFSVITQEGLKISTLNNTIYQFSDNLTFQFVRDPKFNDYTLAAYINYSDKVYSLEIKNEDTFEIDSRFLNEKKEFLLSFSLTNGEEIIHLGTINYRVKDAFGSTTSPLPGQKEVWTALVEQEVDDYFLKNYQSQLDDFNQKYEEIKKIASSGGGGGSNITVDSSLSSTSTNPVQNKILKAELDKKINSDEIKTINGESIIGDGNIQVEADVSLISRVEKTADDTTVSLDPNTLYVFPEMASLSISLNAPKDTSIVNEYHFIFESGATATTFSLPDNLKVDAYSIDANKIYEVSILESICYVRGVASA